MSVSVRVAVPADASALADLAAATFALACPPHTTAHSIAAFVSEVLSEDRFAGYLADPDRMVLVAEDSADASALGYAMLIFGEPTDHDVAASVTLEPTVELSKFYVRAAHHGVGVARILMQASLAAAREGQASGVWLGVNEENARAIRFYEKCGFSKVGRKRFKLGDRMEHDFVLECDLRDGRPF